MRLFIKRDDKFVPAPRPAVMSAAYAYFANDLARGDALTTPSLVYGLCRTAIGYSEREEFLVLFLDSQHRLISADVMFQGTLNSASIHPREVAKAALLKNAAAVIVSHNHPSGIVEPSQADRTITDRIQAALQLIEVRLLDHVIVSPCAAMSFAEKGWM